MPHHEEDIITGGGFSSPLAVDWSSTALKVEEGGEGEGVGLGEVYAI